MSWIMSDEHLVISCHNIVLTQSHRLILPSRHPQHLHEKIFKQTLILRIVGINNRNNINMCVAQVSDVVTNCWSLFWYDLSTRRVTLLRQELNIITRLWPELGCFNHETDCSSHDDQWPGWNISHITLISICLHWWLKSGHIRVVISPSSQSWRVTWYAGGGRHIS